MIWSAFVCLAVGVALIALLLPFEQEPPADKRPVVADAYLKSDILVLGDSQLSFGAGPVLSGFFADLASECRGEVLTPGGIEALQGRSFAMIGTRSTSLQSWVTTNTRAWELLCHKDKKWGVNASAWGLVKPPGKKYLQIGEGAAFQFCRPPATPLQSLFAPGYYTPRLLMFFVGGNGARRLARDLNAVRHDVTRVVETLPANVGCIFMMTAPIYSKKHNDTRAVAQANLKAAFSAFGNRCSFVEGHTPQTRAAIEGQPQFFKRGENGNVRDPYHANEAAAARFLSSRRGPLCRALAEQLRFRALTN